MDSQKLQKEVFERVERLIKRHGPRLAGTKESLACAEDLFVELTNISDRTKKEDFDVYRGAFLGWIRILVISFLAGVVALWLNQPLLAFGSALLSIIILSLQFFLYLPLLDFFYPKKTARNVYGIIEPKGEIKHQIILSGHHDSARIFNFFIHQPKLYDARTTGSIACVIAMVILALISWLTPGILWLHLAINILLSLAFVLVGQMWFFASKKGTPGAGDNLIASSIALSIGKYFRKIRETDQGLEHTRLIIASFDAEEEGLRGARAFAKKHEEHFKNVRTYMINMDCLYDEKELFFLTSDLNNFVKLDNDLAQELMAISETLGIKTKTQPLAFLTGGTDAAELAKKGVHATTIIGMPWTNHSRSNVYHTPKDTLEHVSPKVVSDTIQIIHRYIVEKDME